MFQPSFWTEFLDKEGIEYETEAPLSKQTSFRTGGPASILARPQKIEQALALQKKIILENPPFFYLSGGSNVLFEDSGFNGLVIQLSYPDEITFFEQDGRSIAEVNGNFSTAAFARKMGEKGYGGFEFLTTIPGKLAGAMVQNAGCYGFEMKDFIREVLVSQEDLIWMPKKELELAYRFSLFKKKKNFLIHKLRFFLQSADPALIKKNTQKYKDQRQKSQPKNRRSGGSVFKNPPGQKAWQIIQNAGMQGYRFGGAMISEEHANFIVNTGKATSSDILTVLEAVRDKVKQTQNIILEPEIVIVGNPDR